LIFNDPRRFGLLELQSKAATTRANRWLKHLGVEPLSEQFNAEFLIEQSRGLKAPIKNVIMNQKRVVGVGNIYASEALYRAGVKPTRPAGRLKATEAEKLVTSIRQVLEKAITAGGSTIRDYRNSHGESGSFQQQFAVYGRAGEPCAKCGQKLKSKVLAGRNTFWCPQCQS
jgi:formamidopyrimidine-DNA glycosylase